MKSKVTPFHLNQKKILVTGASSGIGKEIAKSIVTFGGFVYVLGRNAQRLNDLQKELGEDNCKIIKVDLTTDGSIEYILENVDKLDGIVHSAGLIKLSPYKFIDKQNISNIFSINVEAPLHLTAKLLKKRKVNSQGSIVFISSINGTCVGSKGLTLYCTTKGALSGLVKSLALDLAKNKIRVNEVAPGMINTEGIKSVEENVSASAIQEDMAKYPLGTYGDPSDVANACIYLLSEASKWVTGTKLVIDGGITIV